ncbi:MAG: class I poly(R)-hydroxyalkanoic acid synthase, partial [Hyphomonas sp.]
MSSQKTVPAETASIASLLMAQDPMRLQVLMTTLALANTESQALLSEVMTGSGPLGTVAKGDPMGAADAMREVGLSFARNPMALMQANMDLMQ